MSIVSLKHSYLVIEEKPDCFEIRLKNSIPDEIYEAFLEHVVKKLRSLGYTFNFDPYMKCFVCKHDDIQLIVKAMKIQNINFTLDYDFCFAFENLLLD